MSEPLVHIPSKRTLTVLLADNLQHIYTLPDQVSEPLRPYLIFILKELTTQDIFHILPASPSLPHNPSLLPDSELCENPSSSADAQRLPETAVATKPPDSAHSDEQQQEKTRNDCGSNPPAGKRAR